MFVRAGDRWRKGTLLIGEVCLINLDFRIHGLSNLFRIGFAIQWSPALGPVGIKLAATFK
jgi:hypothetical protein